MCIAPCDLRDLTLVKLTNASTNESLMFLTLQGDARQRNSARSTRRSLPVLHHARDRPRSRRKDSVGNQVQNRLQLRKHNVVSVNDDGKHYILLW